MSKTKVKNHYFKVSLDRDQIRSYIIEAAEDKKRMIKAELKGQLVFLKFDCATRIRTNYMGINVRYVSPTTKLPTTCTLAVVDTLNKHTAKELREILDTVLSNYEIPLSHILCCVTDNASNMVKLVSSMSMDLESASRRSRTTRMRMKRMEVTTLMRGQLTCLLPSLPALNT